MDENGHVHVLVEFIEVFALFLELGLELSEPIQLNNKLSAI